MHQELKGQVAVITGGSGAIGGAIGLALQEAGATAIAFDLHPCSTLPWVFCDVSSDESINDALRNAHEEYGRIDIAIHAAGISHGCWSSS